jgi:hypothetical protein
VPREAIEPLPASGVSKRAASDEAVPLEATQRPVDGDAGSGCTGHSAAGCGTAIERCKNERIDGDLVGHHPMLAR